MADIRIRDTGLYKVGGVLSPDEARAHGDNGVGTELSLKGAEVNFNFEAMVTDDSPILKKKNNLDSGYYEFGDSDHTGIQKPVWQLKGYSKRTSEEDMRVLGRLIFMCQTKGIKELYSADDGVWRDIISYSHYGENEFNNVTGKVTKIYVRIKRISITQPSDKKGFNYTLNLVEIT